MPETFVFLTQQDDSVYRGIYLDLGRKVTISIDTVPFYLHQSSEKGDTKIFVLTVDVNSDNGVDNREFWSMERLTSLGEALRKELSCGQSDKLTLAVHWGGEADPPKQFVDESNKLNGSNMYLTHYSEAHDLQPMTNGRSRRPSDLEAILDLIRRRIDLRKQLIDLLLPLAIDIQALKECEQDVGSQRIYFKSMIESEGHEEYMNRIISCWGDVKLEVRDMVQAETLDLPIEITTMILRQGASFLSADYLNETSPLFLPIWLVGVIHEMDSRKNCES